MFLNKGKNWSNVAALRFPFFPLLIHLFVCLFVVGQVLEFIREGKSVAELMDLGKQFLGR